MHRRLAFLLALILLGSLMSCGSGDADSSAETSDLTVHYDSPEEMAAVLGYEMFEYEDTTLTLTDCSILNEVIGILTYSTEEDSVVTLKMTVDSDANELISILSDSAQQQGSIAPPCDDFSVLNAYIDKDADLCFSSFTYTEDGYTCYLYLSETGTSFNGGFSQRVIDFVDQIYQSSETSSFAAYLDNIAKAEAEAESDEEDTSQEEEDSSSQDSTDQEDTDSESEADESETSTSGDTATTDADDDAADADESDEDTTSDTTTTTGSITLEYYDITLVNVGDAYTLTPSGGTSPYTWTSADSSVATVSSSGTITAVGQGQTTVTCTSSDGLSVDVIVRVPGS